MFAQKNNDLLYKRKDTHLVGKGNFYLFFLMLQNCYDISNLFYFFHWDQK